MRYQKPLKMSPTSTSEGYHIKLCFEKAFKIASEVDFDSKMASQTPPKSAPNRWLEASAWFFEAKTLFTSILDVFWSDLGPHWEQFWNSE